MRFIGTSVQAPADSHTAPITSLEWSPDGQFLASGSYDGSVLIWERNGWRAKHRLFHPRLVNGVRWSPNGTWLATSCADGHCRVWNSESGIETHVLSLTLAYSCGVSECIFHSVPDMARNFYTVSARPGHERNLIVPDFAAHGRDRVAEGQDRFWIPCSGFRLELS